MAEPAPPTVRLAASRKPLTDARGNRWAPAADAFRGGRRVLVDGVGVKGTAFPRLYRSSRLGVRSVHVRLPRAGTYVVTLYLSETRGAKAGERSFDVLAEGASDPALTRVDAAARAGAWWAHQTAFRVAVVDGRLDLELRARRGRPLLSAVEVRFMHDATDEPKLLWSDEFEGPAGTSPDPSRWEMQTGGSWGTRELQYHTDRPQNAALDGDGSLVIAARREGFIGNERGREIARRFTSTRMRTAGRFEFRYGRIETRILAPTGSGLWPAMWAIGSRRGGEAQWPRSGEIDVMEHFGSFPKMVIGALHGPSGSDGHWLVNRPRHARKALLGRFHTYTADWFPGVVQFSLDGRPYAAVTQTDRPAGERWVFDDPFYLVLSLAVGGPVEPHPQPETRFPAEMRVDWLRVTR